MNLIENEYRYNINFKKYVDEFCKENKCTLEDALKNEHVKHMFWRYTDL